MFLRGCELLTSDNWAYSPVTQAILNSSHERTVAFQKESILKSKAFILFSFVWRSVFKRLEPDIGLNEAHNPLAAADVKEIDFHKDQDIYKHMER